MRERGRKNIDDSNSSNILDIYFCCRSMANEIVSQPNIDSLPRTYSTTSLQSAVSLKSRRSSIHTLYSLDKNRRSNGIFRKIEIGFQNVFRRFSKKTKQQSLSALEIQILSTITNFDQNEILDW